jgi:hypothetical protein
MGMGMDQEWSGNRLGTNQEWNSIPGNGSGLSGMNWEYQEYQEWTRIPQGLVGECKVLHFNHCRTLLT